MKKKNYMPRRWAGRGGRRGRERGMGEGRGGEGRPGKGRWEMVWSAECVRDFNVVLHQTKSGTFVGTRG